MGVVVIRLSFNLHGILMSIYLIINANVSLTSLVHGK